MDAHATNKKAYFDYEILSDLEAGLLLHGWEVKSIKSGNVSLKESYVKFQKGKVFVTGMHVAKWNQSGNIEMDEIRDRQLLLAKKEITKLMEEQQKAGLAIIPLKIYSNKRRLLKLLIGVGRGKKRYDKRSKLKELDQKREIDRELTGKRF